MNRSFLLAVMAVAAFVGCSSETVSTPDTASADAALVSPAPAGAKLVSLKLPNMVCNGCAAAVEGDLVKVPGVSNIEFDIGSNNCKFYVADEKLDVKEKLDELAKTNSHIEDWSFAEGS